jgi:hypothetical protein
MPLLAGRAQVAGRYGRYSDKLATVSACRRQPKFGDLMIRGAPMYSAA